jgi:hypothetical protein
MTGLQPKNLLTRQEVENLISTDWRELEVKDAIICYLEWHKRAYRREKKVTPQFKGVTAPFIQSNLRRNGVKTTRGFVGQLLNLYSENRKWVRKREVPKKFRYGFREPDNLEYCYEYLKEEELETRESRKKELRRKMAEHLNGDGL